MRCSARELVRTVSLVLPLLLAGPASAQDDGVPITGDDFVVTGAVKIRPGTYDIADANGDGVVHVRGKGARLDLTGVTLVGHSALASPPPDTFTGVGVSVVDAPGAVVTGGRVEGFKVGVRVRGSGGAVIEKLDASGNFKQRLRSTVEREDASDWLFPHENDDGKWEREYGAGIACDRSPRVVVRECVVRHGQNGLLLQRCDGAKAYDNEFSFNSGWGIALWRTSHAVVCRNSLDWCVRGYSHGRYARGQDSAGILVFEQCSLNVFALNSATHGGDGFFLYAGNETLKETGKGGCNQNVVWKNDFSAAVANGIEATFSRGNVLVGNRLEDCEHGVWAGYSWDTFIAQNVVRACANGVSIEHGHENFLTENDFVDCGTAVHLWWDEDADLATTPWAKAHDTRSRRNLVRLHNLFRGNRTDVLLADDQESRVDSNRGDVELRVERRGDTTGATVETAASTVPPEKATAWVTLDRDRSSLPGTREPAPPNDTPRGRRYILVNEWGPIDPREVRLFPSRVEAAGEARLSVLGTDGGFEVTSLTDGFVAEPMKGPLPATLIVRRKDADAGLAKFDVDVTAKGTKLRASGTLLTTTWDVAFFKWTKDPREDADAWKALLAGDPAERRTLPALDFAWQGGKVSDAVGADRFGTLATTEIELRAGKWTLRTVSDDGIRVWVDDQLVVDDWTHHGPTPHDADLEFAAPGKHRIRVEHFEIDGWAALSVSLAPR